MLSAIPLIILALISCSPAPETLHHVVFDANGGSWAQGTEISLDVPDNAPIWNARPSVPERSGYSFRGWFSDKAATKPYDPDSLVTSDTVLYAGWTADRVFRITFDTEGGSSVAPQLVAEGLAPQPDIAEVKVFEGERRGVTRDAAAHDGDGICPPFRRGERLDLHMLILCSRRKIIACCAR